MLLYMDILKSSVFLMVLWDDYFTQTYIVVIIYISLNDFREKEVNTWLRIYCLWIIVCSHMLWL